MVQTQDALGNIISTVYDARDRKRRTTTQTWEPGHMSTTVWASC
jgi:hypothetical protein